MGKISAQNVKFVFFGTPAIAVDVLGELEAAGYVPAVVVTAPDRARSRGRVVQGTPAKAWALKRGIDVLQPEQITPKFVAELGNTEWDIFVVAMYAKLLPKKLIELPRRGTLNVHPSLLPKLRGPSPVRTAILTDEKNAVGVSVMLLDEEMDHGPVIAQASVEPESWPMSGTLLEHLLAHEGGRLLAETISVWMKGEVKPEEQDHSQATYTKKIVKQDAHINLADDPHKNLLKICAYADSPGAFTFFERNGKPIRTLIIGAHLENGELVLDTVKPEGKQEMLYADFVRSGAKPAQL